LAKQGYGLPFCVIAYIKIREDKELFDYCKDKYVIAKLIVYLSYECSRGCDENILNTLYYSHDCYALGRQLLDEIEDYRDDYEIDKFNIYAYRLIKKYGKLENENLIKTELICIAKTEFNKAIAAIENLPDCGWKRFLKMSAEKLER